MKAYILTHGTLPPSSIQAFFSTLHLFLLFSIFVDFLNIFLFSTTPSRLYCSEVKSWTTWWIKVKPCPFSPKHFTKLRGKQTPVVEPVGDKDSTIRKKRVYMKLYFLYYFGIFFYFF
jgi:hypothetical protein